MNRIIVISCLFVVGVVAAAESRAGNEAPLQRQPPGQVRAAPLPTKSVAVPLCVHTEIPVAVPGNLGNWSCPNGFRAQVQTANNALGMPYVTGCTCVK